MKKLLTLACTVALAATMVVSVSATGSFPANQENGNVELNTEEDSSTNIPVYGYVGEDADITDPDPTDPTTPPVTNPTGTDIEISLPVKMIWAAFASDGGAISSPEYTIENKSAFAVDVELTSFTNTTPTQDQNATIENGITISLTELNPQATDVVGMTTPLSAGTLTAANGTSSTKTFSIGGSYQGNFGTEYMPTYSMVLTFSIH